MTEEDETAGAEEEEELLLWLPLASDDAPEEGFPGADDEVVEVAVLLDELADAVDGALIGATVDEVVELVEGELLTPAEAVVFSSEKTSLIRTINSSVWNGSTFIRSTLPL